MKAAAVLASALLASLPVLAVKLTVRGEPHNVGIQASGITGVKLTSKIVVDNDRDILYATTAKLNGKEYKFQLDTGSSDLWVHSPEDPVPTPNKTQLRTHLKYGKGEVFGSIEYAHFEFGDYQVPSQAFLNVDRAFDLEPLFNSGVKGMLGLSFDSSSGIDTIVKKTFGHESTIARTPLSNIFHQNPDAPNFISVLLGRTDDLDDEVEGVFTISEYVEGLSAVQNEPKIPRQKSKEGGSGMSRWNAAVEGIMVNGGSIGVKTGGTDGEVAIALLDTGYTYPNLDIRIADAIYSSIPGAVKAYGMEVWVVPCLNTTEVVFTIGGKKLPIHPLDLTTVEVQETYDGTKLVYCINTFRGMQVENIPGGDNDMILGVSFLKNVYAVFDWGNESDNSTENPFMQLLSTTTFAEAVPEFSRSRGEALKKLPQELSPATVLEIFGLTPPGANSVGVKTFSAATADNGSKADELLSKIGDYGPIIVGLLIANLLFVLVLTAMGVYFCLRRRGQARDANASYVPVRLKEGSDH